MSDAEYGMLGTDVSKRPSKFSDFKPIVSAKTPVSMMQNHAEDADPYYRQSRGVVPGYQGHVPRARDAFGVSAMGGLAPEANVGTHKKMGSMTGHEKEQVVLGREPAETVFPEYKDKKRGVMPGYAGFRPGSRDHHAQSAFGGIAHDGPQGRGDEPVLKAKWDRERMDPGTDYRQVVGGIVPGYSGHVPLAITKAGHSHWGQPQKGAQAGHEGTGSEAYKAYEVQLMAKSGYSGHVPGARDSYGTTIFNAE